MSSSAERLFRLLLLLLPRSFRREARGELIDVFRQRYPGARAAGAKQLLAFWMRTVADIVVTAWVERLEAWRTRRARRLRNAAPAAGTLDDFRMAVRRMTRRPMSSLVSTLTLTVGIASTLVVTALAKNILVDPLPYAEPHRLVRLVEVDESGRVWWPSYPNLRDWREHAAFLDGVAGIGIPQSEPVIVVSTAYQVEVGRLMRGTLTALGVSPILGRGFTVDENAPGGAPVALVSHAFWRNTLEGISSLDGIALTIGSEQYDVVGVLPPNFRVIGDGGAFSEAAVWLPMERFNDLGGRRSHGYHAVARLRPEASLSEAQAAMNALASRLRNEHGENTAAHTVQMTSLRDYVVRDIAHPLRLLLAGSSLVLLIASCNLAARLLADGLSRMRELSVRMALGAHRARLARQLLIESAVLSVPVMLLSVLVARWTLGLLRAATLAEVPRLDTVHLDPSVMALATIATVVTTLGGGLLPAVMLSGSSFANRLNVRDIPGISRRAWQVFIAGQVCLTILLLFSSGLMIRSFRATISESVGYDPDNVVSVSTPLPEALYPDGPSRRRYYETLLTRLRTITGVTSASMTNVLPHVTTARIAGTQARDGIAQDRLILSGIRVIDPDLFGALRIPVVQGDLAAMRRLGAEEAVVDSALAATLWGTAVPIGQRLYNSQSGVELTVVGVVGSVREWAYDMGTVGTIYVDFRTFDQPERLSQMHVLVRADRDPADIQAAVRTVFLEVDPLVPASFDLLVSQMQAELGGRKLLLAVSTVFASIALLLATIGIYAVVAFSTRRRRREIGIRVALGAGSNRVRLETLRSAMVPVVSGMILGGLGIAFLARFLVSHLVHVVPYDPVIIATAAGIMLGTAMVAADIPARRATKPHDLRGVIIDT